MWAPPNNQIGSSGSEHKSTHVAMTYWKTIRGLKHGRDTTKLIARATWKPESIYGFHIMVWTRDHGPKIYKDHIRGLGKRHRDLGYPNKQRADRDINNADS